MKIKRQVTLLLLNGKKIESFEHFREILPENIGLRYNYSENRLNIGTSDMSMSKVDMIETNFPVKKHFLLIINDKFNGSKINHLTFYSHGVIKISQINPYKIPEEKYVDELVNVRFPWNDEKLYENVFYRGNKIDDFSPIIEEFFSRHVDRWPKLILYEDGENLKIDYNYIDYYAYPPFFESEIFAPNFSVEKKFVLVFCIGNENIASYFVYGDPLNLKYAVRYVVFRGKKKIQLYIIEKIHKDNVDESGIQQLEPEDLEIVKKILNRQNHYHVYY